MTYRGLPADYDAWKTRSDRDDDWWNEPEPEECMKEPADIAALVERLRNRWFDTQGVLRDEVVNALEALQAENDDYEQTIRDVDKRANFWKARAEKAEAEIERLRKL